MFRFLLRNRRVEYPETIWYFDSLSHHAIRIRVCLMINVLLIWWTFCFWCIVIIISDRPWKCWWGHVEIKGATLQKVLPKNTFWLICRMWSASACVFIECTVRVHRKFASKWPCVCSLLNWTTELYSSGVARISVGETFSKTLLNKYFWKNIWKIYIKFSQKI